MIILLYFFLRGFFFGQEAFFSSPETVPISGFISPLHAVISFVARAFERALPSPSLIISLSRTPPSKADELYSSETP